MPFGHLMLNCIGGDAKRHAYLDRNYPDWQDKIEMNMDHRANVYFSKKIECSLEAADLSHRMRSDCPSKLHTPVKYPEERGLKLRSGPDRISFFNNRQQSTSDKPPLDSPGYIA